MVKIENMASAITLNMEHNLTSLLKKIKIKNCILTIILLGGICLGTYGIYRNVVKWQQNFVQFTNNIVMQAAEKKCQAAVNQSHNTKTIDNKGSYNYE